MAPDPITQERVYRGVKADVMRGRFAPGSPVQAPRLAARHGASLTPVREALYRLAGEGLLELLQHGGFVSPNLAGPSLAEHYGANASLLIACLDSAPAGAPGIAAEIPAIEALAMSSGIVIAVRTLFDLTAEAGRNRVLARLVGNLNDRLQAARLAELQIFRDSLPEFQALLGKAQSGGLAALKRGIKVYHRRRIGQVDSIVERLSMGSI